MSIGVNELMYILPVCLILTVLGISIGGVLVGGILRRVFRKGPPMPKMPGTVEFWAQNAYGLWTGGEDCGQWDAGKAQSALKNWYGATDRPGFDGVIANLRTGQTGNVAWDLVRALDLLRIGTAAGFLTPDECWNLVRQIAKQIREHYESWEHLAEGFEQGMHAWQDSRGVVDPGERGRVERNLPTLRAHLWPRAAFDARL